MGENLARTTDLLASNGTNVVLAGVVTLTLLCALGLLAAYLRGRAKLELQALAARLTEEQKQRDEERADRRSLMHFVLERAGAIMGDGNGRTGIVETVLTRLEHGDSRFGELAHEQEQIRAAQDALRAEIQALPCHDAAPCPVPTVRLATER